MKPKIIYAPNEIEGKGPFVFLAGSIEMGTAEDWQTSLANSLKDTNATFLNPRRKDWDSRWVQSIRNPQFREQVEWEMDAINLADLVVFYIDPITKSPITLLELGYVAGHDIKSVVCCPDGFWRQGNVEICCRRTNIPFTKNKIEFMQHIRIQLELIKAV